MELIILAFFVLGLLMVAHGIGNATTPNDTREPYLRDNAGNPLALYVAGPAGDVPQHESFIHDGTAHQNPAVNDYTAIRWFLLFPWPEERQERWYPITNNGLPVDLARIKERIDNARLRRGQVVELVTMPRWAEKQAIRREHGEQLARGVPAGKLRKKGL